MSSGKIRSHQIGKKLEKDTSSAPKKQSRTQKRAVETHALPNSSVRKKGVARKAHRHRNGSRKTINGIEFVTPGGSDPGQPGAQGFIHGRLIRKVKLFETVRSSGVSMIEELTASVRAIGIIEPLVLRPEPEGDRFELVAGHRRLQAAKLVGGSTWEHIPVIIRSDLQHDDAKAIAVAVAENSPDGRSNLNMVDIGRQAQHLKANGWDVGRIAREMALHEKKVRRALNLMDTPERIQEKVKSNELSVNSALELHKLPPKMQRMLEGQVGSHTTASEIRLLRKRQERGELAKRSGARDVERHDGGKRAAGKRPLIAAWKQPTDMKREIASLASYLHNADADDIGTTEYHEIRGALGILLWCRGDLESPLLPSIHAEEMDDRESDMRTNDLFNEIVAHEAARCR